MGAEEISLVAPGDKSATGLVIGRVEFSSDQRGEFAEAHGNRHESGAKAGGKPPKKVTPGAVIDRLQKVVANLQAAEKLNKQLQAQYSVGSPSWHMCESIDDKLHEVFTLLGE